MNPRPAWVKATVVTLIFPLLVTAVPPVPAGAAAADPLGSVVSAGRTRIGGTEAPTGTTVFSGDRVVSDGSALIQLHGGSRIELTKAAANFDRRGGALVVEVDAGLLRFSFSRGEQVEIEAGGFRLRPAGDSETVGELGMNRRGQMAVNILEGAFGVLDTANGQRTEVSASRPFAVMNVTGRGRISGQTIEDDFLSLEEDSLQGRCIVAGGEAYAISGNSRSVITINGTWGLKAGDHAYQVVDCTEEAMIQAGASRDAAKAAVVTSVFGVQPVTKSHTARNAAIIAGVAGAVALPLAIKAMGGDEKSPSSR